MRTISTYKTALRMIFAVLSIAAMSFLPYSYARADLSDTACGGIQEALGAGGGCGQDGGEQINSTLDTVVNIMSVIVGIIAVFMIIIAGFRFVTSTGDPGSTKGARDTIIYAIVGLIIVAIAQFIVKFVLNNITG